MEQYELEGCRITLEENESGDECIYLHDMESAVHYGYIMRHDDETITYSQDMVSGSAHFDSVEEALVHFVKKLKMEAQDEYRDDGHYSVYDVYSASELGIDGYY